MKRYFKFISLINKLLLWIAALVILFIIILIGMKRLQNLLINNLLSMNNDNFTSIQFITLADIEISKALDSKNSNLIAQ